MEPTVLKIQVCDVVEVRDAPRKRTRRGEVQSPYFRPEFKFTMDKDVEWAPARSRAPSVVIDFDMLGDGY